MEPQEIISDLLALDRHLSLERYWGERSLFYNPGRAAPLGVIFASLKDHDGPNDSSSQLSRPGVFRFAFAMTAPAYQERFGPPPPRPPKGAVVELADYDPTRLGELMPHPVYAWMRWVHILAPKPADLDALAPLLADLLEAVCSRARPLLVRHARRLLGSARAADVEDAVQEVLVLACARISTYRWEGSFAGWLYAIATRSIPRHAAGSPQEAALAAELADAALVTDHEPMSEGEWRLIEQDLHMACTIG